MFRKRIQLALIHVAVAMTLVPINSTLNRVMIKELALSATLVSILAVLPYLFSPIQVAIGSYADQHPIFGYRRTPYILLGLLLTVGGLALAPAVVYILPVNFWLGLLLSLLVFGAWGMGYNFASVSYLSLASEISGEKGRSRTIAIMWFFMIVGIIFTAAGLSRLLAVYSPAALQSSFTIIAAIALVLGLIGIIKLEPRSSQPAAQSTDEEADTMAAINQTGFRHPSGTPLLPLSHGFTGCHTRSGCAPGTFRCRGFWVIGSGHNPDHIDMGNLCAGCVDHCRLFRPLVK